MQLLNYSNISTYKPLKWLLVAIYWLLTAIFLRGQQNVLTPQFDQWGGKEGLSQNSVTSLIEDQQGFIWIGTQDGLNRFDGQDFLVFSHDPADTCSIQNNHIVQILEDQQGTIWVKTGNEDLQFLDRSTACFRPFHAHPFFDNLTEATRCFAVFKGKHFFWVSTDSIVAAIDPNTSTIVHQLPITVNRFGNFLETEKEELWIAARARGIICFNLATKNWREYTPLTTDQATLSYNFLYQDDQKQTWVGTNQGLFRFDPDQQQFLPHLQTLPTVGKNILTMQEDARGQIWVGSEDGGLSSYDHLTDTFTSYPPQKDNPRSIQRDDVWALLKDRFEKTVLVTFGSGLGVVVLTEWSIKELVFSTFSPIPKRLIV